MNYAPQDKHGYAVVNSLRIHGPQTVREIAESIGADLHTTDQAIRRMMCRGYLERTGERKGVGSGRANIYRWLDVDESDVDPLMNPSERHKALATADKAIAMLRTSFIPGQFDPFRVLRAQVAA